MAAAGMPTLSPTLSARDSLLSECESESESELEFVRGEVDSWLGFERDF